MITAIDTSVLLDVLTGDVAFGLGARDALQTALDGGVVVACDVVWSETRAAYATSELFTEAVQTLGVQFDPLTGEAAALAGDLWRVERRRKRPIPERRRIIADFLIGAHARLQAEALLTRDRGFYREFFRGLRIIDPTTR